MRVFVFGLGYSALHFARTRRADLTSIAGTVRDADKAAALGREGIAAYVFDNSYVDPAISDRLVEADRLLVSIPPSEDDPVLARFGGPIARAPRLSAIVYLSTVGVYGDHAGAWVDESMPPRPANRRNRIRRETEAAWEDFGRAAGKPVTIFRLAGIYGPGRNALVKLRDGSARRLVKEGQVFSRIHVEDIARSIEAAFVRPEAAGIFNVGDDEPAPPQDVVAYAAQLCGVAVPPEIPFESVELTEMARSFYAENRRVANAKLKRDLGVELAFPSYRQGLAALYRAGEGG